MPINQRSMSENWPPKFGNVKNKCQMCKKKFWLRVEISFIMKILFRQKEFLLLDMTNLSYARGKSLNKSRSKKNKNQVLKTLIYLIYN